MRINWTTPQEGARLARQQCKPIFMEIVVGRLGNSAFPVC